MAHKAIRESSGDSQPRFPLNHARRRAGWFGLCLLDVLLAVASGRHFGDLIGTVIHVAMCGGSRCMEVAVKAMPGLVRDGIAHPPQPDAPHPGRIPPSARIINRPVLIGPSGPETMCVTLAGLIR